MKVSVHLLSANEEEPEPLHEILLELNNLPRIGDWLFMEGENWEVECITWYLNNEDGFDIDVVIEAKELFQPKQIAGQESFDI